MTSQTFFQLAQRAAADTSLMAHLIQKQAVQENVCWEALADRLEMKPAKLAKLALCKKPRESFFANDVAQIVGYSGINRVVLLHLLDCTKRGTVLKKQVQTPAMPVVKQSNGRFSPGRRTFSFGFVAILLVLLVGVFAMAQPGGSEATLVVTAGEVVVNQAGDALFAGTSNSAVSSGDIVTVSEGDTIRLSETAVAQLRLQDGSTVDLAGGTVLSVAELVSTDDSYRVQLDLLSGRVLNRVVRLLKPEDAFEIKTPASTASVRGTVFSVEVQANDVSHVVVTEGVVRVLVENHAVDVPAGFQITAAVGQPLRTVPIVDAATNTPTATAEPSRESTATATDTATHTATNTAVPTQTPVPSKTTETSEQETPKAGTPTRVPGNTPTEVPGNGNPPEGGATPPGQTDPDDDGPDAATPAPTAAPTNTNAPLPTSTPVPTDTPTAEPTPTSDSGTGTITICHLPGGDIEKGITLEVDPDDLASHLGHGDLLGACP